MTSTLSTGFMRMTLPARKATMLPPRLHSVAYKNSRSGLLGINPSSDDLAYAAICRCKSVELNESARIARVNPGNFEADIFDLRTAYRVRLLMEAKRNKRLIALGVSPQLLDSVSEYPSLWLTRIVFDETTHMAQMAIRCNPSTADYLLPLATVLRDFTGNTRRICRNNVLFRKLKTDRWYLASTAYHYVYDLARFRDDLMESDFASVRVSRLFTGLHGFRTVD
jgi:hypothetical protein